MDYFQIVNDKKQSLKALHSRMDADRDLVNLAKYTLTDVNNKKVPNAVSITLNDPAVFAANVESSLGNATEQVTVESDDKQLDTGYIEDFIRATFGTANDNLLSCGRFPLNAFFDQQMCRRGGGAARCLVYVDKGTKEVVVDMTPWDRRYVYYAMGASGLLWGAYDIYKLKDEIEAEAWAQQSKVNITGKGANVLDVWDTKHNEIWLDGKKVFEQEHRYGYTPVAIQIVPMGSMLADKDSLANQGESIFFLIRDLVPELNRLVSVIQSLNIKALDNALLWKSEAGIEATPPDSQELTAPGAVTSADIHGGAEPVTYGELKRSAYLLHTMIETRIQRGSVSNLDLGVMGNQPWSAVSLIQLGEGRDQVFLPRLGARGLLNQRLAEMVIDQLANMGLASVEVGAKGHKRQFQVKKLQGEYDISFKYFVKSPQIDVARYSMAAAAGNLIPDRVKRRDILQREDPDEDERLLRWEEAERLSPVVKMHRTIRTLVEMAKRGDKYAEFEAELLSTQMGVSLKQILAGKLEQPQVAKEQEPEPLVSLFGQAGGKSSAKKAAELQATPRAEGGEE